jgi:Domain of unknown function (DUF5666)
LLLLASKLLGGGVSKPVISRSLKVLSAALLMTALGVAQSSNLPDAKPADVAPAVGQGTAQPGQDSQAPGADARTPALSNPPNGQDPGAKAPKSATASASAVAAATPEPKTPSQPKTELLDTSATSGAFSTDGHDPILDPPPFPKGLTTLVGGVISGVDRIRNHLTVAVFGGGRWTVYFDERTHIFRNGAEATPLALKKGERVYVDTMLDNNKRDIFARNIRVGIVTLPADADGQIVEVDTTHNQLTLRDNINSATVRFAVDRNTLISRGSTPVPFENLRAGSLVRVKFAPDRPNRGLAREIAILAAPGSVFTFVGTITFLDTHRGVLAIRNASDGKTYDIHFVPARTAEASRLSVGAEVQVIAAFESTWYSAQQVTVTRMAGATTK